MPNIFTCDAKWFEKLKKDEEKVVVAVWCGGDERCNAWLEKLSKLEKPGTPVFVIDMDSCPAVAENMGAVSGETLVFRKGEEKARVSLDDDQEGALEKVRKAL